MNKDRLQRLISTLYVQTKTYNTTEMQEFIINFCENLDVKLINDAGNIYITKGESDTYPCIVAHTDTVHDLVAFFEIYKSGNRLFSIDGDSMERVGIGGDDKVGVFVALEMLLTQEYCKVAFFKDEEHGCLGSREADMEFFDDVCFVLQCDRAGYNDFIHEINFVELYDNAFSEAISPILTKYKRKEKCGGLTDVMQLKENGLKVCCANMSCGYYDPHTDNEFVDIDDVNSTLKLVEELFDLLKHRVWEHEVDVELVYNRWYGGNIRTFDDKDKNEHCYYCGSTHTEYDDFEDSSFCFTCGEYYPDHFPADAPLDFEQNKWVDNVLT